MTPQDLQYLLAQQPDLEEQLLEHALALTLTGQARLLLPPRPGEAREPDSDVDRLSQAVGRISLGLVRLKKLRAGCDLQCGDFILRLPNRRGAGLRLRWPGHPVPANDDRSDDVQIAQRKLCAENDVQFSVAPSSDAVQIPAGENSPQNDVQFVAGHASTGELSALGTDATKSDVQIPKAPRRRGAPVGNRNRWVHGRRSAAAAAARGEVRRLVAEGAALLQSISPALLTTERASLPKPLPSRHVIGFLPP